MLLSSPDHLLDQWGKPHFSPYTVTYCFFAYIFLFLNVQYKHHQFAFVMCESVIPYSSLCNPNKSSLAFCIVGSSLFPHKSRSTTPGMIIQI